MSDDLLKANKELSNLQKENESLTDQICEEYKRAMREFKKQYPPLKIVDRICFTNTELKEAFLNLEE